MAQNSLYEKYGLVVDAGKDIFVEGQAGDRMFIIQDGNVRISKVVSGKHHTLAVLGKGDFFGEMAIVNQVKRTATATAAGTVKLLSFDRQGFLSMIESNARIALNIIDKLCRRLQQANTQIQHLVKGNERDLIALNLYYTFAEHGMEKAALDIYRTARDVSLGLEIPQEATMELIQELESEGIVSNKNGVLRLADKARFVSLAENAGVTARLRTPHADQPDKEGT